MMESYTVVQGKALSMSSSIGLKEWIYDETGGKKIGRCDYFSSAYAKEFDPEQPFVIKMENLYHANRYSCDELGDQFSREKAGIKFSCEWVSGMQNTAILEKPDNMTINEVDRLIAFRLVPRVVEKWEFAIPGQ